jgi:light-regulated signal transduction histidine kinase (bacteriophytochrome)
MSEKQPLTLEEARARLSAVTAERDRLHNELKQFQDCVSHDLRRPIRQADSFAQILIRRCREKLAGEDLDIAEHVVKAGQEAQDMLEGLLRVSRVFTRGRPFSPADFNAVLDEAENSLRPRIEKCGATIEHEVLPEISCDKSQIKTLFICLIDNALKFRKPGDRPIIKTAADKEDNEWLFSIEDNGIGMPPGKEERIFAPFQKLNRAEDYPGTGLGLTLSRAIVERHGGRIYAESAQGKGSRVCFVLPDRGRADSS